MKYTHIYRRQDERRVYSVHKAGKFYFLVRVLNQYERVEEAYETMIDLFDNKIKEEDVLQEFTKKGNDL